MTSRASSESRWAKAQFLSSLSLNLLPPRKKAQEVGPSCLFVLLPLSLSTPGKGWAWRWWWQWFLCVWVHPPSNTQKQVHKPINTSFLGQICKFSVVYMFHRVLTSKLIKHDTWHHTFHNLYLSKVHGGKGNELAVVKNHIFLYWRPERHVEYIGNDQKLTSKYFWGWRWEVSYESLAREERTGLQGEETHI